jgi:4-amino-4-deoxy-L-arabinose transferase-like glycosyltransferase
MLESSPMQRVQHLPRPRREAGPRLTPVWLVIFVVALALRVGYTWLAIGPDATPSSDSKTYDTIAWNLSRGAGFAMDSPAGPRLTAWVPPVVPWITSLLYRVLGHRYFAAMLLQCVIGALVPLLLGGFAGALFGGTVGRLSGWIAAVHPLLVFFSGYLLTETTFCATLLLALLFSAEWIKTPRNGRALGAGIAWGLATLTRPTALPLPLLVALWAWQPLGLTVGAGARLRQIALVGLGLALVVGPWTVRNAVTMHAFIPVTTGAGGALMVANNAETWDDPALRGGASSTSYQSALAGEFRGLDEVAVDARARDHAWTFMRGRVGDWPAIAAAKVARFWRLTTQRADTGSWQRPGSPLAGLLRLDPLLVWSVLTLPFAVWGVVRTLRGSRRWFQALPLLIVLHFTLVTIVFFGSLRMRVPVEPLMALFIALGLDDARRRIRLRASGLRVMDGRREAPPVTAR